MVAARHGWHHPSHRGAWWTSVPGLVAPAVRAVVPRPAALLVAACALVSGSVVQVTVHQMAEDDVRRATVAAEAAAARAAEELQIRVDGAATSRLSGQATAYLAHRRTEAREIAEGAVQTADALASAAPDVVAPEDLAELSDAMTELSTLLAQTPDADAALSRAAAQVALTAPADTPSPEPVAEVGTAEVLPVTPLADAVELLEGAARAAEVAGSPGTDAPAAVERPAQAASRATTSKQSSKASAAASTVTPDAAARPERVAATPGSAAAPTPADLTGTPADAAPAPIAAAGQDPAWTSPTTGPTTVPLSGDATIAAGSALGEGLPAASVLAVADLDLSDSERLQAAAERVLALSSRMQQTVDEALAQQRADEEARAAAAAEAEATARRLARLVTAADASPNGAIPAKYLCGVSFDRNVQLRCDAAAALEQLNAAYVAASGHNLRISSSYRTAEQQAVLHEEKGDLAATAGTSNHGRGQAIDLTGAGVLGQFDAPLYLWLTVHAADFGWHHPSYMDPGGAGPLEPWHWEYGTTD